MEPTDKQIRAALEPFGVSPDGSQSATIRRYVELLLLWNRRINLTSVTEPQEILMRHFGESMFAVAAVPIGSGTLIDIGSGAGFPGLALKIVCPALSVRLVEPVVRKGVFLSEVARSLNLQDVEVITKRIEEIPASSLHAQYVTARAVGDFQTLLKWARTALSADGQIVLWLGQEDATSVAASPGWSWLAPIPIPRSSRRVLLVGRPT